MASDKALPPGSSLIGDILVRTQGPLLDFEVKAFRRHGAICYKFPIHGRPPETNNASHDQSRLGRCARERHNAAEEWVRTAWSAQVDVSISQARMRRGPSSSLGCGVPWHLIPPRPPMLKHIVCHTTSRSESKPQERFSSGMCDRTKAELWKFHG